MLTPRGSRAPMRLALETLVNCGSLGRRTESSQAITSHPKRLQSKQLWDGRTRLLALRARHQVYEADPCYVALTNHTAVCLGKPGGLVEERYVCRKGRSICHYHYHTGRADSRRYPGKGVTEKRGHPKCQSEMDGGVSGPFFLSPTSS